MAIPIQTIDHDLLGSLDLVPRVSGSLLWLQSFLARYSSTAKAPPMSSMSVATPLLSLGMRSSPLLTMQPRTTHATH